MKVKFLLDYVSLGQNIRIVFLDDNGDEVKTLGFENDRVYNSRPEIKEVLDMDVEYISSTEDDYLRIEVYE